VSRVAMSTSIGGGLVLKNPVMTASGTCGYGLELEEFFDISRLGGIVVKGLSPEPRAGNPPVRIVETPSGMLNAIGLQNIGVRAFVEDRLPRLRTKGTAIVANIFGETLDDYSEVAEALAGAEGLSAVEVNLSCPNTARGGMVFGVDPRGVEEVTTAVKRASRVPVIVKLTPNVTDITEIARAAVGGGADSLSLINTFVAMVVDVEKRRPVLANGTGGLSGPAIRPLAVWCVHQVAHAVSVPVIGIGGITCARDALEFIIAGASAVQVGTIGFATPAAPLHILEELEAWCAARGVTDIRELIGSLRTSPRSGGDRT
jgi:dihydroorotate dehydrogenase (NAD+) catalytic subunit